MRSQLCKRLLVAMVAFLLSTAAFAQPPEEVPPPLPEGSENVVAPAPTAIPVAEPKIAAPIAPPEDKRVKGVTLSPSFRIIPFGRDSVDVTGPEGKKNYFSIKPEVGLSTSFKTPTDKTVDLSLDYALEWREYYNKETSRRDFDNDVSGSLGMTWSELVKSSLDMEFDYFFKVGADTSADNTIMLDIIPSTTFTVTKELSFTLGYHARYLNIPGAVEGPDGLTDVPTDVDEARRGGISSDVTGVDNFSGASTVTAKWFENRIQTGVSYAFPTGTTLGFDYHYIFLQTGNFSDLNLKGHYIIPSVSQPLPWKGGNFSLKDELRLRKYDSAEALPNGPGIAKQDFRNRLTGTITQEINDNMNFEMYYRLELVGNNGDDYSAILKNHKIYAGINFKF